MIPEAVLQQCLIRGFKALRNDLRLVDTIFKNLDQNSLQQIRQFLLDRTIDFAINYPRTGLKAPAIILLLRTEQESEAFLGNVMGTPPYYDMPDPTFGIDTLGGHGASTSGLSGLPKKIIGPLKVESSDGGKLFFQDSESADLTDLLNSGELPQPTVYVVKGTGVGQKHLVLNLSNISLDIDGVFDPQLDSSSLIDLRETNNTEIVGEPSRVYEMDNLNVTRYGVNYSTQYQLNVVAGSPEEVIYIYNIVKALLLSQTAFLEGQGIQALKISGSDLAPRTEMLPDEVFQRAMTLQFTYPFDFIKENGSAFSALEVEIDACDPNNGTCVEVSKFTIKL